MFKFLLLHNHLYFARKPRKTSQYLMKTKLSRRQSCTSKLVTKNYLKEIWDAIFIICTMLFSNTKIRENIICVILV